MPEIVTGISMMLLFAFLNMSGFVPLVIAHISFCVPSVFFSVLPKLRQINKNMYEAALDLGCNPFQAFFKVVLPEIMPGVITGFLMAITYSLDDFVVSYFTAGNVQTLSITIYSMVKKRVSPEINALSTIMFVVVLLVLLVTNIRSIQKERAKEKKMMKL
jgi:spermidine/putrescine transport system permease protein